MVAVQRVGAGPEATWTVVGDDHLPVAPVEEFLEFMRVGRDASPHTVRSYATALASLWAYLSQARLAWDELSLPEVTGYLRALRAGEEDGVSRLEAATGSGGQRRSEATVATRWAAVSSFYRYHAEVNQVPVGEKLYRSARHGRRPRYVPALAHTHQGPRQVPVMRVRRGTSRPVPLLSPAQVAAILDDCAHFDPASASWVGSVRDRLLFATMAETGLRLGECLSLRHRDWHVGQGSTPFLEVVPATGHPHRMRAKSGQSRRASSASTASTSGASSTPAPRTKSTTWTATGCSSTCRVANVPRPCAPSRSMPRCARSKPTLAPPSRPTGPRSGPGTPMRAPCFWLGRRRTSSCGASATPTSRQRSGPTAG